MLLAVMLVCARQIGSERTLRERDEEIDDVIDAAAADGETAAPIIFAAILLPAATALDSPKRRSSRARRCR